jgi:isoleucyl-tRNA synthetase
MMNPRTSLQVAIAIACVSTAACADEVSPSIWDQIRNYFDPEPTQLEEMIDKQEQLNAVELDLDSRLEQNRQLRAMHREITFQSELNIAWIRDELDNWDCRVADQKVIDVQRRIDEMTEFAQRVDEMCMSLGQQAYTQARTCNDQRDQIVRSISDLERMRDRYARSCDDFGTVTFETQGEQPWQQ